MLELLLRHGASPLLCSRCKDTSMLSRVGDPTNQAKALPGAIAMGSGGLGELLVPARGGLRPRAFARVREYILTHLAENISNRVLAELAGSSVFHFARAFRRSAGMSPHRFVLLSRVERVKHLLVETALPLSQIAIRAGFTDQSHCTRRFRELVGITPSRFRWLRR